MRGQHTGFFQGKQGIQRPACFEGADLLQAFRFEKDAMAEPCVELMRFDDRGAMDVRRDARERLLHRLWCEGHYFSSPILRAAMKAPCGISTLPT